MKNGKTFIPFWSGFFFSCHHMGSTTICTGLYLLRWDSITRRGTQSICTSFFSEAGVKENYILYTITSCALHARKPSWASTTIFKKAAPGLDADSGDLGGALVVVCSLWIRSSTGLEKEESSCNTQTRSGARRTNMLALELVTVSFIAFFS